VSLDDERVLIRNVDGRSLGTCTRVDINRKSCSSVCSLQTAWRFGDASGHEPGLALRIQSHGFGYPFAAPALECTLLRVILRCMDWDYNVITILILIWFKNDTLQVADLIPDSEMCLLKKIILRRRDFVVAEAIRLKAVSFPAYRGRHPQSGEAVLAGFLNLPITMWLLLISSPIIENDMRDLPAKTRLRGSRSDKTESDLLSGLSREASTKRRSDISRISNSFQVVGIIQQSSKSPCKEHTSYSFVQHI